MSVWHHTMQGLNASSASLYFIPFNPNAIRWMGATHRQWHYFEPQNRRLGILLSLRWLYNERDSVSNHQPHDCLLNRLFRRRSKQTSKLRVTGLCVGNSPGTGEFPAQMASNAENVSIWWRHHVIRCTRLAMHGCGILFVLNVNWNLCRVATFYSFCWMLRSFIWI